MEPKSSASTNSATFAFPNGNEIKMLNFSLLPWCYHFTTRSGAKLVQPFGFLQGIR